MSLSNISVKYYEENLDSGEVSEVGEYRIQIGRVHCGLGFYCYIHLLTHSLRRTACSLRLRGSKLQNWSERHFALTAKDERQLCYLFIGGNLILSARLRPVFLSHRQKDNFTQDILLLPSKKHKPTEQVVVYRSWRRFLCFRLFASFVGSECCAWRVLLFFTIKLTEAAQHVVWGFIRDRMTNYNVLQTTSQVGWMSSWLNRLSVKLTKVWAWLGNLHIMPSQVGGIPHDAY